MVVYTIPNVTLKQVRIAQMKIYYVIYLTRQFFKKCTRIYWPFVNCATVRKGDKHLRSTYRTIAIVHWNEPKVVRLIARKACLTGQNSLRTTELKNVIYNNVLLEREDENAAEVTPYTRIHQEGNIRFS